VELMTKSEVLQFHNGSATESAGERRDDGTHMFKHAENTMAANPKTLEFSVRSEFSVGTAFSLWQNGHVERLIGLIRSESLDHLIVFDEAHLRHILKAYASYYNEVRTHLSLDKDAPEFRRTQKLGRIAAIPILGGRHHQYVRV
jgi:hypothetical protein